MNTVLLNHSFRMLTAMVLTASLVLSEEAEREGGPMADSSAPIYTGTAKIVKSQLQKIAVDTRVITGKDLQVLDNMLPKLERDGDNKLRENDLYLLIRLIPKEPLDCVIIYLEASVKPEKWPFDGNPFPDTFTFPHIHLSSRPAYHLQHLMAPGVGSSEYRDAVIGAKWLLNVSHARCK